MKNIINLFGTIALVAFGVFATMAFRPKAETFEYFEVEFTPAFNQIVRYSDGRKEPTLTNRKIRFPQERMKVVNAIAQEGWELQSVNTGEVGTYLYTFKRTKPL